MKLSVYKETFYEFSKKASKVSRNAAYAGIALIWVFKFEQNGLFKLPDELLIPAGLFALGIGLDLLHYVSGALIWGGFHRSQEKKLKNPATEDPDLDSSSWLTFIINSFFTLKIVSVITGYVFVANYLINALKA